MAQYYRVPLSEVGAGPPISRQENVTSLYKEQEAFDNPNKDVMYRFCCFVSKKRFFTVLNALAAIFHLSMFIMTIVFTCNSDAKCNGPIVYTYQTNLTYVAKTTSSGFELVPKYVKNVDHPIYLVSLPLIFFGLSFTAHVAVSILSGCTNIYRDWLLTCQQPIRWIEYCASVRIELMTPTFLPDSNRR